MTFRRLVRLLVFRSIREEKFLSLLSIIGVALGIGLFVGVKSASDRAVSSFEHDVRGITSHANYEILDTAGVDFPEGIYRKVREIDKDIFPMLETTAYLKKFRESVRINGIYTVRAMRWIRSGTSKESYDMAEFYRSPNGVMITRSLARRLSLSRGDSFSALVYDRSYSMKVVDILESPYLPPDTVVMDLGNYQDYFHKTGYLSRIDLRADEKSAEKMAKVLPPDLTIERKQAIVENRLSVLKSFRYNLQFVSFIAVLVGVFLLYNTIFISVVKRRTEIGILRGLGMGRRTVTLLFVIQGLILGLAGSILGIGLGQAAAYLSSFAVERTISSIYRAITISDYFITRADALLSLGLGLFVSAAASAVPAYESSRVRPNESSKEGSFEGRYKGRIRYLLAGGLFLVALGAGLAWVDYSFAPFDFPFLSYGGMLLVILGFSMVSPSYLSATIKAAGRMTQRLFPVTGKIALGDIRGSTYRFSVALMSVAISSALIMALLTLIFSFRMSLGDWINKNIAADIYIMPSSCTSNFCFFPLSPEIAESLEGMPGVAAVDRFRTLLIDFHGRKIVAGFGDTSVRRRFGPAREAADGEAKGRHVGISYYLSARYGIKKGDAIELQTPAGPKKFVVGDVFSSYSTTSGFIYLDRKWLREFWGLDDATQLAVYAQKGVDVDRLVSEIKKRLLPRYSLDIMNNEVLRRRVFSIFDKTFSITYAIELISIIVSLMGVVNTLLALVLERKREISIIRYLGGSWKQIRETLVFSAGIVGIGGIVMGLFLGGFMSVIFIKVINKISFGWIIHFRIPLLYLAAVSVLLFLTTLAAGLIPSKVAKRIDPKRFISFE